jgi:hypothetical protein
MSHLVSIFTLSLFVFSISHVPIAFGKNLAYPNNAISTDIIKVKNKASYCDVKPKRFPSKKPAVMAKGAAIYKGPSRICGGLGRTKSATRINVIGTRARWYYIEAISTSGKTIRGWAKASTVFFEKSAKTAPPQAKKTPVYPKDMVVEVQQLLMSKGYDLGKIDGVFGPATKSALIAFQRDAGVKASGKMDLDTLVLLKSKAYQPSTSPPDVKSNQSMFPKTAAWVEVDPDTGKTRTVTDSR